MAQSPCDVETEVTDLTDISLSEIDTLEPSCRAESLARILAADADPADPLYGGQPPVGVFEAPPDTW
ncbi:hypothetical protein GCM10029978_115700 [Actinoallomurus acanthiterrae]